MLSMIAANAQDLIVKQDGESIKAYRTDVGNNAVYYRLEDNDQAPVMMIGKSDVLVVKLQDGTVITMNEAASQKGETESKIGIIDLENYVPKFPKEPVADPEMIAHAEIGSLIEFYDGSKGIVFYLDGNGHGLAVYLYENLNLMYWQNAMFMFNCADIMAIPNIDKTDIQIGLGALYCDAAMRQLGLLESRNSPSVLIDIDADEAIKQLGAKALPAMNWCRSIGPDWYLPSLGELCELLVVANQCQGSKGPISKAIKANGGNPITYKSNTYLSSTEKDNTQVYVVLSKGTIKTTHKYDLNSCRAVRMF